uniref:Uncharacterized protein n=1 Tax=Arundo donax TaxID=35708 RepID=A0A0A9GEV2_ARUDO
MVHDNDKSDNKERSLAKQLNQKYKKSCFNLINSSFHCREPGNEVMSLKAKELIILVYSYLWYLTYRQKRTLFVILSHAKQNIPLQ